MATPTKKKFTQEEMDKLKGIRKSFSDVSYKLGQLEMQRLSLKEEKELVVNEMNNIIKSEKEVAKELLDKYGKGTIDIDSGEFIPSA